MTTKVQGSSELDSSCLVEERMPAEMMQNVCPGMQVLPTRTAFLLVRKMTMEKRQWRATGKTWNCGLSVFSDFFFFFLTVL